jgi:hypothetical protein
MHMRTRLSLWTQRFSRGQTRGSAPTARRIVGWTAVVLSTAVTCFWAFWGIIENFHEGWYFESWLANVGLMLTQYLSPMLLFMGVTLIAIYRPRIGAGLTVILALFTAWFFNALTNTIVLLLIVPLVGLGLLYWYGRALPRRSAAALVVGLPLITLAVAGFEPTVRVSQRIDDGNRGARLVQGNGKALIWAPAGPGWPRTGTDWYEARQVCDHLNEDGLTIAPTSRSIWRLPAVEEAVRSMARHGRNSGGEWDVELHETSYETSPDKESPLWDSHSQVIYWWTSTGAVAATDVDDDRAYIIAYDGKVWPRLKTLRQDYLGFRCVKEP